MKWAIDVGRKILVVGGWAPLLVFTIHAIASRGFHAYTRWPSLDIPMHFAGGLVMAFFLSRCFRALPREVVRSSRLVVLELILVGSLTTCAAVAWEFAEFTCDRVFDSNIQISLANTMQDLALGVAGATAFLVWRARQLRAGRRELQEIAMEWAGGRAA
jgi:hypothetical protein